MQPCCQRVVRMLCYYFERSGVLVRGALSFPEKMGISADVKLSGVCRNFLHFTNASGKSPLRAPLCILFKRNYISVSHPLDVIMT